MKKWIKKLHEKGIVSKKPNPIIPFVVTLAFLIIWIASKNLNLFFNYFVLYLTVFSFVFSIIHWIVVRALN